jgi:hypothetical protein
MSWRKFAQPRLLFQFAWRFELTAWAFDSTYLYVAGSVWKTAGDEPQFA